MRTAATAGIGYLANRFVMNRQLGSGTARRLLGEFAAVNSGTPTNERYKRRTSKRIAF